jgi:hypothetical protein
MSQAGIVDVNSVSPGVVETLTGNTGGAVGPNGANNINVVGTGSVTVTGSPGTNTLTISVTGSGLTWHIISTSQSLVSNNGYICVSPGAALALALPAVSVLGDIIEVTLDGATSFSLTQGAGQQIRLGTLQTTLGAGGSITSTHQGDTIRMVCQTANTKWNILSSIGNLTVV